MTRNVHPDWKPILRNIEGNLRDFLYQESLHDFNIFPSKSDIFSVFKMSPKEIKVVILNTEPYPHCNFSNGKAFGLKYEKFNAELKNISEEIIRTQRSLFTFPGFDPNLSWNTLEHLQKQGVFLLNTSLTSRRYEENKHIGFWIEFTKRVIRFISSKYPCVWMLWGELQVFDSFIGNKYSIKRNFDIDFITEIPITPYINYVLQSEHPRFKTFIGCNHFLITNKILERKKLNIINW